MRTRREWQDQESGCYFKEARVDVDVDVDLDVDVDILISVYSWHRSPPWSTFAGGREQVC